MILTKQEKRTLQFVKDYQRGMASAGMYSHESGLKVETTKRRLKKLEERGFLLSEDCRFHANTKIYELTESGSLELTLA